MKKKAYEAPYFRPRFVSAVSPLMVSQPDKPTNPFEGGLTDEEFDEAG